MKQKLFTLQEVAKETRMSWAWVDRMIRADKIKVVHMGGTRLINEEELSRLKTEGVKKDD